MLELRLYIPFLALNISAVLHNEKFLGNVTLPAAFLIHSGCSTIYVINDPLPVTGCLQALHIVNNNKTRISLHHLPASGLGSWPLRAGGGSTHH